MSGLRGVRIVNNNPRGSAINPAMTDVYDLETGDKLLNIYGVALDVTRAHVEVVMRVGMPFEYEGPAKHGGLDAIISAAYGHYDSDPRVHGPDDFDAFSDAIYRAVTGHRNERPEAPP